MFNQKTVLIFLLVLASCYCQQNVIHKYYKKKKHHHGLHHIKFLHYLIFLAIKLKLVVFFGTLFTVGLIAAKIIGIIKLTEFMKYKHPHHEEKIVYVNPHEHHDYGGYSGGFSGPYDFSSPKEYSSSSYPQDSDITLDHPPDGYAGNDRLGNSGRNFEGSFGTNLYEGLIQIGRKIRGLNITEQAFNEMGITDDVCKRRFVCEANYNAGQNSFLETGFNILSDDSYQKYKPNITVTSEDECNSLYKECKDDAD